MGTAKGEDTGADGRIKTSIDFKHDFVSKIQIDYLKMILQ